MLECDFEHRLAEGYRRHYSDSTRWHESPAVPRMQMAKHLSETILRAHSRKEMLTVVDLCSGPGSVYREMLIENPELAQNVHFITNDVVKFAPEQMFTSHLPCEITTINYTHLHQSALHLSFPDESADVVLSHFGVDFLHRSVFTQIRRILAHDGEAIFHFHHPVIFTRTAGINKEGKKVLDYMAHVHRIFASENEIVKTLAEYGLAAEAERKQVERDGGTWYWWWVRARHVGMGVNDTKNF